MGRALQASPIKMLKSLALHCVLMYIFAFYSYAMFASFFIVYFVYDSYNNNTSLYFAHGIVCRYGGQYGGLYPKSQFHNGVFWLTFDLSYSCRLFNSFITVFSF